MVSGILIGILGSAFLEALQLADRARVWLIDIARGYAFPGWLLAIFVALLATAVAAWLAYRFAPQAPQSAESDDLTKSEKQKKSSNISVLSVNFFGTTLAVGSGLVLGPERPAIQMGGTIGKMIGRLFNLDKENTNTLLAASGGAAVATMFNSPLGCAAYTVETVLKKASLRISLIALGIGSVAVAVVRLLLDRAVNYNVDMFPIASLHYLFFIVLLGCIISVLATLHVHITLFIRKAFNMLKLPRIVKAGFIGAIFGYIAWASPMMIGMGDIQTQNVIDGIYPLSVMAMLLGVRFFLGPLSLSANSPGGYFTPVLLLGALCGGIYSILVSQWLDTSEVSHITFVLVGMAVALATIARSPFTGILLVIETTGTFSLALPMIIAVLSSMALSRVLQIPRLNHGLEVELAKHK